MGLNQSLSNVIAHFNVQGDLVKVTPIEVGHIHYSYKIETAQGHWFLQKINHHVFQEVAGMMANVQLVTNTLGAKYGKYESLQLVPTKTGEPYALIDGEYWRVYDFKNHLLGYDMPTSATMVAEAAKAFANFVEALHGLPATQLAITIPNFHSLSYRMQQLEEAIQLAAREVEAVGNELEAMDKAARICLPLEVSWQAGALPTRIVHNDTKFNNLLFDKAGKARCVIDLDTVMPGIVHFDIGDTLRTLASNASEDEQDLNRVTVNTAYYFDYIKYYTESGNHWLTTEELANIPLAAPYMALIMAVRFMADYLAGDKYFHCKYPGHNLVRAKAQLTLAVEFLKLERLW